MGVIKQMHIDCTPFECVAPAEFKHTCYVRTNEAEGDVDPTEPGVPAEGDFDPRIDVDQE